jgi:hypothetical protein
MAPIPSTHHDKHSPLRGIRDISAFLLGLISALIASIFLNSFSWASPGSVLVWLLGGLLLVQISFLIYSHRKNRQLTDQLQRLRDKGRGASRDLSALPPEATDFKEFLASAPLEGIDLTRDRSRDRLVEL